MNTSEFRKWLEERIATLGTELEECLAAKKALNKAQSIIDNKARMASVKKEKTDTQQPTRAERQPVRQQLLDAMAKYKKPGGYTVQELTKIVPAHRKRISNSLYNAFQMGQVEKLGEGRWQLTQKLPIHSATEQPHVQ